MSRTPPSFSAEKSRDQLTDNALSKETHNQGAEKNSAQLQLAQQIMSKEPQKAIDILPKGQEINGIRAKFCLGKAHFGITEMKKLKHLDTLMRPFRLVAYPGILE